MKLKKNLELRQLSTKTFLLENLDTNSSDFNKIVTFNSSAAFLWHSLEQKEFTTDDMVGLLEQQYGIDNATAQKDAESVVISWKRASLIEV